MSAPRHRRGCPRPRTRPIPPAHPTGRPASAAAAGDFEGFAQGVEAGEDGGGAGADFRGHRCDIGHENGGNPGSGGGKDAVGAVLHGEAAGGGRAEGFDGAGKNFRVRLAVGNFVAAHEGGETLAETGVPQFDFRHGAVGGGRHGEEHPGVAQKVEEWQEAPLVGHGCLVQAAAVTRVGFAHEGVEIASRRHDVGEARAVARLALPDHRLIKAVRYPHAGRRLRLPPCRERDRLGVEEGAVHVEDDGGGPRQHRSALRLRFDFVHRQELVLRRGGKVANHSAMPELRDILDFCDERTRRSFVKDFPGAENGLQIENDGTVSKIGAAVDAGESAFRQAVDAGVDFLIVHHGLFWSGAHPFTGALRRKLKLALDNNLAVYSSHLPLDAHHEIGNNILLAKALGLEAHGGFVSYEGVNIGLLAKAGLTRAELRERLAALFPAGYTAIEKGGDELEHIGILTGSGRSALPELRANGCDTLVTGELRQEHFTVAEEEGLNLYLCGHYATETFGVRALADETARLFRLESVFLETECPL